MTIIAKIPHIDKMTTFPPTVWYGCYDGGWQNLIKPESMAHPAKYSRNLISRIYSYALERGYLRPGMVVLDCFAGVGLGALDAQANGLSYVGVELESRFHDMGQGCNCTGITKADWIRFYGRWDKMAHKDGNHWCPQCLTEAKQVTDSRQLSFFEPDPTAAYVRGSGIIPSTQPHYYRGNLDLFKKYAKPGTWAVLLNGDSRYLRQVIGQAQVDGLLSSPPYASMELTQANGGNIESHEARRAITKRRYSATDGNLGGLPEGSLADSLLSSPPYANGCAHTGGADPNPQHIQGGKRGAYGVNYSQAPDNLGNLPEGSLADSLVSSPPFAGNTGGRGEASRNGIDAALFDRHSGGMKKGTGDDPGNLDHLPMRGFTDALVSSPPFENQDKFMDNRSSIRKDCNFKAGQSTFTNYGQTTGQLGIEQGQTFWAAAKDIVSESFLALKPGAYTFWVVKNFVRDGAIVDFRRQWKQLCEACGFEFVEHIQAMLIQSESEQGDLNGDVIKTKKARKSFFRRLHEKRFPHLAIDNEDVLIMRKPG